CSLRAFPGRFRLSWIRWQFPGWHRPLNFPRLRPMEIFQRILQTAVAGGASDIHVKVGGPIIFRINRQLIAIEAPAPTETWINNIVEMIVPKHAKKRLEEDR